jgi:hypothetical protein
MFRELKAKAVPLHATEALGWRGGIAPTHSRPRHKIRVSGQRHAQAALYPRYPLEGRLGGLRAGMETEAIGKILSPLPGIEPRWPGCPARNQALSNTAYRFGS